MVFGLVERGVQRERKAAETGCSCGSYTPSRILNWYRGKRECVRRHQVSQGSRVVVTSWTHVRDVELVVVTVMVCCLVTVMEVGVCQRCRRRQVVVVVQVDEWCNDEDLLWRAR